MFETSNAPPVGDELEVLVEAEQEEGGLTFTGETLYRGWTSLSIVRPLAAAAGGFTLEVVDRRPWPLRPGSPVRIRLAGETMLRGYVDTFEGQTSPKGRRIRIAGRDRTADLVDCSAMNNPGEWNGLDALGIAQQIAEPFDVEVVEGLADAAAAEALRKTFPVFKIQPGETAWSAIERLLRARSMLGYTNGEGTLILARPGATRSTVPLVEGPGGNVLKAKFAWTSRDKFASYIVRGQAAGDDDGWGEQVSEVEGFAFDESVTRHRPWLLLGETALSFSGAADRAQWEASVRAAKSQTLNVEVQGWRRELFGTVWKVNEIVPVKVPSLGIDGDFLVSQVGFTRKQNAGTKTKLQLIRPDAYKPQPTIPGKGPLDDVLSDEEWNDA